MKLPFDFGIKLIFRLVLPGFLLSLGLLPLLRLVLQLQGWADKWEYAFVVMIILLGWAVIIADMPIYMLMEGRSFWPDRIREFFQDRLKLKLKKVQANTESANANTKREAWFSLRGEYEMSKEGDYVVNYPTRLGNVIHAYEGYSRVRYGLDAIFYWPRVWLKLDKDTREDLDNTQALVDSTVYAAFVLYTCGVIWVLYALTKLLVVLVKSWFVLTERIQYDLTLIDQRLPKKGVALMAAAVFMTAGYVVYRVSTFLCAQYGENFKSVFDVHISAINIEPVMKTLSALTAGTPCQLDLNVMRKKQQFPIAARYLQYYRYKCPKCEELLKPDEIKSHLAAVCLQKRKAKAAGASNP